MAAVGAFGASGAGGAAARSRVPAYESHKLLADHHHGKIRMSTTKLAWDQHKLCDSGEKHVLAEQAVGTQ